MQNFEIGAFPPLEGDKGGGFLIDKPLLFVK